MKEKDAMRLSLDLLESAETAVVTTMGPGGYPQTRAMFNLRRREQFPGLAEVLRNQQEDFLAYFTTNTSSPKIDQIKKDPKGSVYYCRPAEFRGLLLSGKLEIVEDRSEKEKIWQKGWERYYPGGVHDPDHTVLRLRPILARYYHQLSSFTFNLRSGG